ncbi:MAG: DUF3105 domain-containing protein, partial [Rubrobacteraceae bacterium]
TMSGVSGASGGTTTTSGASTGEQALTPVEATVGPKEESGMMPAGGKEPDPDKPPPENPPEGVKTYPAGTNRNVNVPVDYPREPPTNGDHAPIWQNCGFYPEPVNNVNAVHSLDHGAVWITYRPDLPQGQIDALKPYGKERYVLISPYPGQPASVIATSWRNQLYLDGAGDQRLRQFVDQFRITETAPLSGNGCVGGVGRPGA